MGMFLMVLLGILLVASISANIWLFFRLNESVLSYLKLKEEIEAIDARVAECLNLAKDIATPMKPIKPNNWTSMKGVFKETVRTKPDERN